MKPLALLVRDVVAPVLRRHGFKRSGGTFRAISDAGVAVIEISGRGAIGTHNLDFSVGVGFTTREQLGSSPLLAGMAPEKVRLAIGYSTWHESLRDPGLTAMDLNHTWRFNQGDQAMESLFATILDLAATDVLTRLHRWPELPEDSLSHPPVFPVPIERENRSLWRTGPDGTLDMHYARSWPVDQRRGYAGERAGFGFDLTYDLQSRLVLIGLDAAALRVMAGGLSLADWAPVVGLRPAPTGAGGAVLPLGSLLETGELRVVGGEVELALSSAAGAGLRFPLGSLPEQFTTMAGIHGFLQVVFLDADADAMQALTWRARTRMQDDGQVWFASVPLGD